MADLNDNDSVEAVVGGASDLAINEEEVKQTQDKTTTGGRGESGSDGGSSPSGSEEGTDEDDDNGQKHPALIPLLDLPLNLQKRLKALRKNQLDALNLQAEYFNEVHALEMKYDALYKQKFLMRKEIVTGAREPTEEEADFPLTDYVSSTPPSPREESDKFMSSGMQSLSQEKGIPWFWSTVLQSAHPISYLIESQDIPVLKHLIDIRCELTEAPMGFKIFFEFEPNEYFSNTVLTKTYFMRNAPEDEAPLAYEGPEIFDCEGCTIDWKSGKNTTKEVVEKRQKHKKTGNIRTVTKTVKKASFFGFFTPPAKDKADEEEATTLRDALNEDFEIGHLLRERVVPNAVTYFTGEALESESESSSGEEEEDDEEDEENENGDGDRGSQE